MTHLHPVAPEGWGCARAHVYANGLRVLVPTSAYKAGVTCDTWAELTRRVNLAMLFLSNE